MYRQRARYTLLVACLIFTPLYIFSGSIIKACGQDPEVAEKAGKFIILLVPGTLMQGFVNIDDIMLNSIEKASYAMVCLFLVPPIHLFFCWLLALHLNWGPNGIAISFLITNTIVFVIQAVVLN